MKDGRRRDADTRMSMRRGGGEGKPSVFMTHMMTCGRVVSRSPMRRMLNLTASNKPDKSQNGRNTCDGNECCHPKYVNAEKRCKAQAVVEQQGEGVGHRADIRWLLVMASLLSCRHVGDDAASRIGSVDVSRNRCGGLKVQVTLDAQAELAAQGLDFREPDGAVLRETEAEVAKPPKNVIVVGIDSSDEPGATGIRREELHNRPGVKVFAYLSAPEPVALQLLDVLRQQKFHGWVFRWVGFVGVRTSAPPTLAGRGSSLISNVVELTGLTHWMSARGRFSFSQTMAAASEALNAPST